MPLPIAVYPHNFTDGNIINTTAANGAPTTIGNKWVATYLTTDGVFRYPKAVIGTDLNGVNKNSKSHLVTTEYLTSVLGGLGTADAPTGLNWNGTNNRYEILMSSGTPILGQSIPMATQSTSGVTKLATGSMVGQSIFDGSDILSTTPNYVNSKIQGGVAQAAQAAAAADVFLNSLNWDNAMHKIVAGRRNEVPLELAVPLATQMLAGLVNYMVKSSDFPTKKNDDTGAVTAKFVDAAIAAGLGSLSADKMLQPGSFYTASTNMLTLKVGDSPATAVDLEINMTGLLNDAINEIPDAADTLRGLVKLNLGTQVSDINNNADALTTYGFIQICAMSGANAVKTAINNVIEAATTALAGKVQLTPVGFTVTNPTNESMAVTPAELSGFAGAAKAKAHDFATIVAGEKLSVNQAGTQANQNFELNWEGLAVGTNEPIQGNGTDASPITLNAGVGLAKVAGALVNTQSLTGGTTVPTSPVTGSRWENQSAVVVAGVPAGAIATWNGTEWKVDTNPATGGGNISPLVTMIGNVITQIPPDQLFEVSGMLTHVPNYGNAAGSDVANHSWKGFFNHLDDVNTSYQIIQEWLAYFLENGSPPSPYAQHSRAFTMQFYKKASSVSNITNMIQVAGLSGFRAHNFTSPTSYPPIRTPSSGLQLGGGVAGNYSIGCRNHTAGNSAPLIGFDTIFYVKHIGAI